METYRGDGWQMVVTPAAMGLRVALLARATLRSRRIPADTRMALAIGRAEGWSNGSAQAGFGEAFVNSGRMLDSMRGRLLTFWCPESREAMAWDSTMAVLDELVSLSWRPRRAAAIAGTLRGLKQREIAELMDPPVTQANIAGLLSRAGWRNAARALEAFESRWAQPEAMGLPDSLGV